MIIKNNINFISKKYSLFIFLWVVVFLLYLPAANAGFVTDFTGWLDQVSNHSFIEFINRTNFHGRSLYQFTQFNTWFFYQLFHLNSWLWHLLFITLHIVNAYLLYNLCNNLMVDIGIKRSKQKAFIGVFLFCISPYMSETIVWEPSFHFLQGLLLVLLILNLAYHFLKTGNKIYPLIAGLIYFLSTFSLEIFYITPWLIIILGFYYRYIGSDGIKNFKKIVLLFFLPELILFCLHLLLYHLVYGGWVAHIATDVVSSAPFTGLGKPAKYIFHLLFLGRFLPFDFKTNAYKFLDSKLGLILFYTLILAVLGYLLYSFRKTTAKLKFATLLFTWMLITLALLIPLWFGDMLLVIYDRYTYFTCAFFYMLIGLLIGSISIKYLRLGILAVYSLINLRFTILVSRYWGKSSKIISGLYQSFPYNEKRTILLLNIPQCLNGVPMIGAEKESEFKFMHNLLLPNKKIATLFYDVYAYNMNTPTDGVHARVLNDSVVDVTLNQWGTWWWYATKGGYDYENNVFKTKLIDGGNTGLSYQLKLKKPAGNYLLLFQTGNTWKSVNMNNHSWDQY